MSVTEREAFLAHKIIVEEKVDGANLGISFDSKAEIVLQNRGSCIALPGVGQWKHLEPWVALRKDVLFDVLEDKLVLFGEWCYAKHSVFYDNLPDWFLGFDIFDKLSQRFYSLKRRNDVLSALTISPVPIISIGKFTLEEIVNMIGESRLGSSEMEGVFLRYDTGKWCDNRAKLVHPCFMEGIEEHWGKRTFTPNKIHYFTGNPSYSNHNLNHVPTQ